MWGHSGTKSRGDVETDALRPWPHVAKLPAPLANTELLDAADPDGEDRLGLVWHRRTGLVSATALLDSSPGLRTEPAVAEAWTACWWALLRDACAHPEIRAAAVTVDATTGASPVRFTVTVDPGAIWQTVSSVAEAAAITARVLDELDVGAAGVVLLRWATPADLARTARAAFEPHCRWLTPDAEPPAWGELTPRSEAVLAHLYRHERYASTSWALHAPAGELPDAAAVPALVRPGRYPRRVTLVRRHTPQNPGCSVYVTATVPFPGNVEAARVEVEALHPSLEPCRSRQVDAFSVGLPRGWFR